MSIMDNLKKSRGEVQKGEFLIAEDPFGGDYPGVFELLTRVSYLGKDRKAGRLILYAELNRATLVLCDVEAGMVAFYGAKTFHDAFKGLEEGLQYGTLDWRVDKKSKWQKT